MFHTVGGGPNFKPAWLNPQNSASLVVVRLPSPNKSWKHLCLRQLLEPRQKSWDDGIERRGGRGGVVSFLAAGPF